MPKQSRPQTLQEQLISKLGAEVFKATEEHLVFGSAFLIPNEISGIPSTRRGKGKTYEHPFVVLKYNKDTNQIVTCVLRTTNLARRGVYTPARVLPELDKEGIIVIDEAFRIDAQELMGQHHLGILPEPYLSKLKTAIVKKGWI